MIKIIKDGLTEEETKKRIEQREKAKKKQKDIKVKCNDCECEFIANEEDFEFTYMELCNPNGENRTIPQRMFIVCHNCKRKIFGRMGIVEKDGVRKFWEEGTW